MTSQASKRRRRWGVGILILLLFGGGAGLFFGRNKAQGPELKTEPVTRTNLTQSVTATGQLNPLVNVQVGSQISGMIDKLYVDYNSPVKKGQVIAQIDPATYHANVQQADGNLASARAALELAQINAKRAQNLFRDNLIPESDNDNAQATLHQAQAQVKICEANLERAKVDLSRCTIYAPVDGVVISRNVDVGQTVAASLAAPTLFVIANDLRKMQIDANVSEADIGGVQVGQDVEFTVDAFPYRTYYGEVLQIRNSPITVQNVVTYDTVIAVSNTDLTLKPGMTANVSIITARRHQVLAIPNAALRFHPTEVPGYQIEPASPLSKAPGGRQRPIALAQSQRSPAAAQDQEPPASGRPGQEPGTSGPTAPPDRQGDRPSSPSRLPAKGVPHTVYVLTDTKAPNGRPFLRAVHILTGISDGARTEVLSGLKEKERVVTGIRLAETGAARTSNPFSLRRRF